MFRLFIFLVPFDLSFWSRLAVLAVGLLALVLASRSLVRVLRITHGLALARPRAEAGLRILTVVWFTRYVESKSKTYGAIGAALAILLWACFLGRIVVSGAMLNAALWEQEHRGPAPTADPPPSS